MMENKKKNPFQGWSREAVENYALDLEIRNLKWRDQWRVELSFLAPALFLLGVAVGYIFFT
jgi:hypothetical protein